MNIWNIDGIIVLNIKGRRLDKLLLCKIPKIKKEFKWDFKAPVINGIRVSYNGKFVQKLKAKDLK